jgi:hypothetical protein
MKLTLAALSSLAACIVADLGPYARFGLAGGQYDKNGYGSNGLDVFGFNNQGQDSWGRLITDDNAGLVAPQGKALVPNQGTTTTGTSNKQIIHKKHHKKHHKHHKKHHKHRGPSYTIINSTEIVPVVETTEVIPTDTITINGTVPITLTLTTQAPVPEPTESCINKIVQFTVFGGNLTDLDVNLYLAQVAYLCGQPVNSFRPISINYSNPDEAVISAVICSLSAYDALSEALATQPDNFLFTQPSTITVTL